MAHTTTVACQPGHPRGRRGRIVAKRWQGDVVARIVHDALALRRLDDPESVTEATRALVAGVKTLLDRRCLRRSLLIGRLHLRDLGRKPRVPPRYT